MMPIISKFLCIFGLVIFTFFFYIHIYTNTFFEIKVCLWHKITNRFIVCWFLEYNVAAINKYKSCFIFYAYEFKQREPKLLYSQNVLA